MSSLRRRAICVQRARSIARSSTGGRASARTTAPASPGSTSSRSQASRSRTSARWKNAAAPASRYGTARSSSATATAWPSLRDRAHEHADVLGRDVLARDQPLDLGGDRLRLRALVRAAPERDLARPPAAAQRLLDPVRRPARRPRAAAASDRAPGSGSDSSSRTTVAAGHSASEVAQVLGRRAAEAVDRLVVVAGRGDLAVLGRPAAAAAGPGRSSRPAARRRARGGSARDSRARTCGCSRSSAERVEHEVAEVERRRPPRACGRGRRRARRTRARARARASSASPSVAAHARVVARRETSSSLSRSMRATIEPSSALGLPRRSWRRSGSSSMRSSSIASRSARRDRRRERVEPGLERLVAQQPRAEAVERRDRQLLVAAPSSRSSIRSRSASAAASETVSTRIDSGASAVLARQPGEALDERRSSCRCRRRRGRAAGRRRASTASRWAGRRPQAPP